MQRTPIENSTFNSTPSLGKTIVFGLVVLWAFLFAYIFDDVRHRHENLFLFFGVPFWCLGCAIGVGAVRSLWHLLPQVAPRNSSSKPSPWPEALGVLFGLAAAFALAKSPLMALFYDCGKFMMLLVIAGWALGVVFQKGGFFNVVGSLLTGVFCGLVALLVFFLIAVSQMPEELWGGTWALAGLGVPFSVAVSLYDCTQMARHRKSQS